MTKFNKPAKNTAVTTNYEGEKAFKLTPELELYTAVVTSTLSNKYYETSDGRVERIRALIAASDPEFVAKLAVYAREKMYMRTMPLVVTAELAHVHNNDNLVSRLTGRVVQRVDEITELLAYYLLLNKRSAGVKKLNKLSNQIRKGLAASFNKFSEYQFAKYDRAGEIKLRDALFLAHPVAKNAEQQELFDKIVESNLKVPYTWEVQLSEVGQKKYETEELKKVAFKKKWEELIDSGKMGYMATMRNLRNILEAGVDVKHLKKVCEFLSDKEEVSTSKQFPFRFLSAYREIKDVATGKAPMVLDALEEAMQASAENIKGFGYNTSVVIACDTSGSMQTTISERSKIQNYDIGLVLGMLLQSKCKDVATGIFGDTWKIINLPKQSILANADELHRREGEVGYSTNGYLVLEDLLNRNYQADKIMIFTDCQLWNSNGGYYRGGDMSALWTKYKAKFPESKLYLFDLSGYGNTPLQVERNGVHLIAGWSDKVFDILEALENSKSALSEIEAIKL